MGESFKSKMPLYEAQTLSEELTLDLLRAGMEQVEICGSVRRRKPEVGDLDVIGVCTPEVFENLKTHTHRWRYADGGKKKCTVEYRGRQVNILRSTETNMGAAMLYFTGNSTFNLIMRRKAKKMGMKLNEYGLWVGDLRIAGETELGIFEQLNMKYLDPTERSK